MVVTQNRPHAAEIHVADAYGIVQTGPMPDGVHQQQMIKAGTFDLEDGPGIARQTVAEGETHRTSGTGFFEKRPGFWDESLICDVRLVQAYIGEDGIIAGQQAFPDPEAGEGLGFEEVDLVTAFGEGCRRHRASWSTAYDADAHAVSVHIFWVWFVTSKMDAADLPPHPPVRPAGWRAVPRPSLLAPSPARGQDAACTCCRG
jgi:hypothetical protein